MPRVRRSPPARCCRRPRRRRPRPRVPAGLGDLLGDARHDPGVDAVPGGGSANASPDSLRTTRRQLARRHGARTYSSPTLTRGSAASRHPGRGPRRACRSRLLVLHGTLLEQHDVLVEAVEPTVETGELVLGHALVAALGFDDRRSGSTTSAGTSSRAIYAGAANATCSAISCATSWRCVSDGSTPPSSTSTPMVPRSVCACL